MKEILKKIFTINTMLYVLVAIAIILGVALRSIEVLNKNYVFGFDQGRDYLAVWDIVKNHKLTLIGSEVGAGAAGLNGIFQGPFHYYFLSIPFILMKGDPYGGVILMFLFSVSSILFFYFFGKKLFGVIGSLIGVFVIALSPMFIAQARLVWNSNPSTIFILLALYFTYLGYQKKYRDIFLSSFFSGFIYNFQFAVSIPLCASLIIYYIFIIKLKSLKKYAVLFTGFILAFLPMLLFEIRHGFMSIKGFITYLFVNKGGESFLPSQKIIIDHLNSFFNAFTDVFPKNVLPTQILFLIVIIPSLFYLFKEKNIILKKFVIYLFILFPAYFFVFLFFRNAIWVYYLVALNVVYILFFAYAVATSFKNKSILRFAYILFLLFILVKTLPSYMKIFVYDYGDYGGVAKIKGKEDAIDFIYNDAKG